MSSLVVILLLLLPGNDDGVRTCKADVDSAVLKALPQTLFRHIKGTLMKLHRLEPKERDLHNVEIFAGQHQLSDALNDVGLRSAPIDILLEPEWHNILSKKGSKYVLRLIMRIQRGGTVCGAPPCGT